MCVCVCVCCVDGQVGFVIIMYGSFAMYKGTKWEMVEQIRADIRDFKKGKNLDKVSSI